MSRIFAHASLCLFVVVGLVGCKATDTSKAQILSAPAEITPLPPVTSEVAPGEVLPPPVGTVAAATKTETAAAKKPSWIRQWLPTDKPNDPEAVRGEYKNGFWEPDFRGISD